MPVVDCVCLTVSDWSACARQYARMRRPLQIKQRCSGAVPSRTYLGGAQAPTFRTSRVHRICRPLPSPFVARSLTLMPGLAEGMVQSKWGLDAGEVEGRPAFQFRSRSRVNKRLGSVSGSISTHHAVDQSRPVNSSPLDIRRGAHLFLSEFWAPRTGTSHARTARVQFRSGVAWLTLLFFFVKHPVQAGNALRQRRSSSTTNRTSSSGLGGPDPEKWSSHGALRGSSSRPGAKHCAPSRSSSAMR